MKTKLVILVISLFLIALSVSVIIDSDESDLLFDSKFNVPPLMLEGRVIDFVHTDDNSSEDIIIKTDRRFYEGDSWADVYISVTNTTNIGQNAAMLFYFLKDKNNDDMATLEEIKGGQRNFLAFFKKNIKINSPSLGPALKKRESMPDSFEVRSGTQINLPANSTAYFLARLEYVPETSGEFWIETLGDKGGYGLLDPVYGTSVSADTYASWYSNSWTYRRKIAINEALVSGSSNLSNFPVVISVTDATFKHTSFGGNVASASAGFTGGGGDFVFTSSDGTTKLDHEIEKYASSSGELLAWVEVPTLSVSADTYLYVYYGGPSSGATNQNKTGVWDANYKGVWHLPNGTTLTALDSTSNGENWTVTGATAGNDKIDGLAKFDGTNDILSQTIVIPLTGTLSMWWKPNEDPLVAVHFILRTGATSPTRLFDFTPYYLADRWYAGWYNNGNDDRTNITVSNISVGTWYYLTSIWTNGGETGLYIDAVSKGSGGVLDATWDTSAATTYVAADPLGEGYAAMDADEIRLSNIARSADWIKTEYNNQASPPAFFSLGGQQTQTVSEPLLKIRGGVQFR